MQPKFAQNVRLPLVDIYAISVNLVRSSCHAEREEPKPLKFTLMIFMHTPHLTEPKRLQRKTNWLATEYIGLG